MSKVCTVCKERKPLAEFGKHSRQKDGIDTRCRQCNRAAAKAYRDANLERVKGRERLYREAHRDEKAAYDREYRERNSDKKRENDRRYREQNRDEVRAMRQRYRETNPGKVRAGVRRWYRANTERAKENIRRWQRENPERVRAHARHKSYIRRAASKTSDLTMVLVEAMKAHAFVCPLCSVVMVDEFGPSQKNLDHIVPLSVGGMHMRSNVRVVCRTCNIRRPRDGSDAAATNRKKVGVDAEGSRGV